MSAFDGNRDGQMNMKERLDQVEFRYGDRDDDGAMNRKEFAHVESKIEQKIIGEKYKISDPNEFNRYDTNHDGLVDAREYARGEAQERQG